MKYNPTDTGEKGIHVFGVSEALLRRTPKYYKYICKQAEEGGDYISSSELAQALGLGAVQVRKDLALLSSVPGQSRVGFSTRTLKADIEKFLGYNVTNEAILVGVGNMGAALLAHKGFARCGLKLVAAFDVRKSMQGKTIDGKPVLPMSQMAALVEREGIKLAIIAVPASAAQGVCNKLVKAGIEGILNLSPTHIDVPHNVMTQDEDIASALSILAQKVTDKEAGR